MTSRDILVRMYLVMLMGGFIAFDLGFAVSVMGHASTGLSVMGFLQIALGSWRLLSMMPNDKPKSV
jgi:hypothetical protein